MPRTTTILLVFAVALVLGFTGVSARTSVANYEKLSALSQRFESVASIERKLDEVNAVALSIVEDQKVFELSWEWKNPATQKVHKVTVKDTDFQVFQTKVATAKAAYPDNI